MPVRSLRLAVAVSVNGVFTTVYTCPAGKTAILKSVRGTPTGGGNTRALVAVASGPLNVYVFDFALGVTSAGLEGLFIVLEPGDTIRIYSEGQTFNARCSGAELDGLAP